MPLDKRIRIYIRDFMTFEPSCAEKLQTLKWKYEFMFSDENMGAKTRFYNFLPLSKKIKNFGVIYLL